MNKKITIGLVVVLSLMLTVGAVKAIDVSLSVDELRQLVGMQGGPGELGGSTSDNWTVGGNLAVTGTSAFTGATTVAGALAVTGATTLTGDVTMTGALAGYKEETERVSSDNTLTSAESGLTTYIITTGSTSTLPAVSTATGTIYRFQVAAAFGTRNFGIDSAEGDNIEGSLIVAGAVVDCDAEDQINFIVDGENIGDYVEVVSDGQQWMIRDSGALTSAKMTCTDPS